MDCFISDVLAPIDQTDPKVAHLVAAPVPKITGLLIGFVANACTPVVCIMTPIVPSSPSPVRKAPELVPHARPHVEQARSDSNGCFSYLLDSTDDFRANLIRFGLCTSLDLTQIIRCYRLEDVLIFLA